MQLIKRELPSMHLVVDRHLKDFEQQVLDVYFDMIAEKPIDVNGGIPHLVKEMLYTGHPKFLLAGIYDQFGDGDLYFKETSNMTYSQEAEYVQDKLYEYFEDYFDENNIMRLYHDDIEIVLDYYNLCFINTFANPFSKEKMNFIQNSPLKEVW